MKIETAKTTPKIVSESAYTGLFWMSKDFSTVTDIEGLNKFTIGDLKNNIYVQPIGGHYLYNFDKDIPRGRVELQSGKIKLYLGEDFPKEKLDSIKSQIIQKFKLQDFESAIEPSFHWHWKTQK